MRPLTRIAGSLADTDDAQLRKSTPDGPLAGCKGITRFTAESGRD